MALSSNDSNKIPYQQLAFTADGSSNGTITVASTDQLRVGARVYVSATAQNTLELQIATIISATTLACRDPSTNNLTYVSLSAYTVASGATLTQPEQIDFRRNADVTIHGSNPNVSVEPLNTTPAGTEYGLPVRVIGGGGGGGGTVDQGNPNVGSKAWPVDTVDTSNTIVKPGDAVNNAIRVNIVAGAGGGTAMVDEATFTEGTSSFTPVGGEFNDSSTALTAGKAGVARLTNNRALHSNLRNSSGTEIATASNPLRVDPTGTTTQPVSGTVTANAGTNLNTSALALDTSVNGVLVAQGSTTSGEKGPLVQGAVTTAAPSYSTGQTSPLSLNVNGGLRVDGSGVTQPVSGTVTTSPPANASTNVAQFGGNAVVTGTGVSGSGIPRVTISSDSSLAANQSVNVAQVGGNATATAASGVQKVGVVGNAGAAMDAAGQNASSPANELLVAGQFNTSPTVITSGNVSPLQLDANGNLKVNIISGASTSNPTSASQAGTLTYTSSNNAVTYVGTASFPGVIIQIISTSVAGGPIVTFEGSPDSGTTWYAVNARKITTAGVSSAWATTYSAANETVAFYIGNIQGLNQVRVRVSTTGSAGTGATTINLASEAIDVPTWAGAVGVAVPPYIVQVGGSDGANLRAVRMANDGTVRVDPTGSTTQPVSGTVSANDNITQIAGNAVVTGGTNGSLGIGGLQAANTALVGNPVVIAGSDYGGTAKAQDIKVDASGFVHVTLEASTGTSTVAGTVTANQGTANSLANAWSTKITDTSNGPVAVKAASTAAAAADPALVVSLSPNSPTPVPPDTTGAVGALNGSNATATVALTGQQSVGMLLAAGTLVGTIVPEISPDGSTWIATDFYDPANEATASSIVFGSSNAVTVRSIIIAGGITQVRVRVSAYTSGTANCTLRATLNAQITTISEIYDGTNVATIKAASTAAQAADTSLVVGLSPNSPLPTGANIIGALTANQSVNVAQIAGNTTSTAASGVQKVGIVGNAGGAMDAAGQNAASPANELLVAGQFNTSPTTITSGNISPLQVDNKGNLLVNINAESLATVAVSGTVTANQGTANSIANAWSAKITDTTNGPAAVKPASTAAVATDPALVVAISPNNSITTAAAFSTRSDTFTVTGNGTTVDTHTAPLKYFSVQVKGTGAAATSWTVVLEGSLNNTQFTTILTHNTAIGDGNTVFSGAATAPALYFRSRVSAISLGSATNIVVTILGT